MPPRGAWAEYWQPAPRPGWHDLLALTKRREAMLEGDLHPFMAHLQYFKDVLALPRHQRSGSVAGMTGHIEPMVGRYVHVEIGGETHRIYFEENGAGIPLVCLHTAGSDERQWRHLLGDEEFAKNFRIIAFDMPWHGKSNPPASWSGEEYQLTTARYTETIRAFCKALELEKPVVMGCSIGGRIVLNLAIDHAAEFRALIGLEAADFQAPWYDTAWLNRPDVHGGEVCAALVSGLIAPQSPEALAMRNAVGLQAGRPRRLQGRSLFLPRRWRFARPGRTRIDTKVCPLYLLTGEYDFSCTPEDTKRTAAAIGGARVTIMEQLGHFPMSENPEQFRRYIAPVLNEILKQPHTIKQGVHV